MGCVMNRGLCFLVLGLCVCVMSACGPIKSTTQIGNAETSLEAAKLANAEKLAPYEYYMAQELLRKAREEWGYSDFEMSADYAEKALDFAEKAREKASTDPWQGPPASAIEGQGGGAGGDTETESGGTP